MESSKFDEAKWGISLEDLRASIDTARDDRKWFFQNLDSLRERYLNNWVAIRSKKVIGADENFGRLTRRLEKQLGSLAEVEIMLVPPKEMTWIL